MKPEADPFVKKEKDRSDKVLLLIPNSDTASVKQRQGKLEVKALVAGPRPFSQGAVVGRVDQWVKWSFEPSKEKLESGLKLGEQLESELDQSGPWRRVDKTRYVQKYSFNSGLVAVSPDKWPNTGCNIELTRITVKANVGSWLTFGFETFGSAEEVAAFLDEAIRHFFTVHGQPPVRLDGHNSLSYPAWLALCVP